MPNNPEEFPPEIRAAFDNYPRPTANAAFDAKFWRELDARQHRYRGIGGVLRHLIEVEIEGIAVWRLGFALFGGAAVCALGAAVCALGVALLSLGAALLSLGAAPMVTTTNAPQIAEMPLDPFSSPRFARELWDARDTEYRAPKTQPKKPKGKEEISCVSFAHDLA